MEVLDSQCLDTDTVTATAHPAVESHAPVIKPTKLITVRDAPIKLISGLLPQIHNNAQELFIAVTVIARPFDYEKENYRTQLTFLL